MKFNVVIKKADQASGDTGTDTPTYEQIVMGEVYVPMSLDADQEFMTAEEIRKMAHAFLGKQLTTHVDTQHNNEKNGCIVVESFIARDGDPDFIPGSWVIAVWCPLEMFNKVLSGEINGFSVEAEVLRKDRRLAYDLPDEMYGMTSVKEGHDHRFKIYINDEGLFAGGITAPSGEDGHYHLIKSGTITELAGNPPHRHNFEFIEMYINGNPVVLS